MKVVLIQPTGATLPNATDIKFSSRFDKSSSAGSASFTLIDPVPIPKAGNVVEIYKDNDTPYNTPPVSNAVPIFSGTIKSIEKAPVALHNDPAVNEVMTYSVSVDSWELATFNHELILFEEFRSKTAYSIISSIVSKYMTWFTLESDIKFTNAVMESVRIINRRPNEVITDICEKIGAYWGIVPAASSTGSYGKIFIRNIMDSVNNYSGLCLTDNSNQYRMLGLKLTDTIENAINDLYLTTSGAMGSPIIESIHSNGFTGSSPLQAIPYGLDQIAPVLDEFNGDDLGIAPDASKWSYVCSGATPIALRCQYGRLQLLGLGDEAIVSKKAVTTSQNAIRGRLLEVEFTTLPTGGIFRAGLHSGEQSFGTDRFLLGIQIGEDKRVKIVRGNSVTNAIIPNTDKTYSVELNTGDPRPYQFQFCVEPNGTGKYDLRVYVQNYEQLQYGTARRTLIYEALNADFTPYVAICPAHVTGGVRGTVIQGSLMTTPLITAKLREEAWFKSASTNDQDDTVVAFHNVNWLKHDLSSCIITWYNSAGDEVSYDGVPTNILSNTATELTLYSWAGHAAPPANWFAQNNIVKAKLSSRPLVVGTETTNDYEAHIQINIVNNEAFLKFFQNEVPTGTVQVAYRAVENAAIEVTNAASMYATRDRSPVKSDTGIRKEYQDVKDISSIEDLITYGRMYLTSQIDTPFAQGEIETDQHLYSNAPYLRAGSLVALQYLTLGRETVASATPAYTYISGVEFEDVGAHLVRASVSIGNIKSFIQDLFVRRLAVLRNKDLTIDAEVEKIVYQKSVDIASTNPEPPTPIIDAAYITSSGLYVHIQEGVMDSTDRLLLQLNRIDTAEPLGKYQTITANLKNVTGPVFEVKRVTGAKDLLQGTLSVSAALIARRTNTLYLYSERNGVRCTVPATVVVRCPQPVTTPLYDVQQLNGVVHVMLQAPYSSNVTKRIVYVNNSITPDNALAKSDKIFTLKPEEREVTFLAYDTPLYITVVDQDAYSEQMNDKPYRFDRQLKVYPVPKPPDVPSNIEVYTKNNGATGGVDTTLAQNQVKIVVTPGDLERFGRPTAFLCQFRTTAQTWPNAVIGSGAEALVSEPSTDCVTIAGFAVGGAVDSILMLKYTYTVTDENNQPKTINCMMCRGITKTETTADGVKVYVNLPILLDKGSYAWEVWNPAKWYGTEAGGIKSVEFTLGDSNAYTMTNAGYEFTHTFDQELAGYCRVFVGNQYGIIAPSGEDLFDTREISAGGLDTSDAPLVSDFTVQATPFALPDKTQMVRITCTFTKPTAPNFSHIKIYSNKSIVAGQAGVGVTSGSGVYAGSGLYKQELGDVYEASSFEVICKATGDSVTFYAVSVNTSGWFDPDWYNTGKCVPSAAVLLDNALDPPAQVTGLNAEVSRIDGINIFVQWNKNSEYNVDRYRLQFRYADTPAMSTPSAWTDISDNVTANYFVFHVNSTQLPDAGKKYFQFRVAAVNSTGGQGAYSSTAPATGITTAVVPTIATISAPTNVQVVQNSHTQYGIKYCDFTVTWTSPSETICGGVEISMQEFWSEVVNGETIYHDMITILTRVKKPDNTTVFTVPVKTAGHKVQFYLTPFNLNGIVPDYGVVAATSSFDLDTVSTITVPQPLVTDVRQGSKALTVVVTLPNISNCTGVYKELEVYSCVGSTLTTPVKIIPSLPVGGVAQNVEFEVSWDTLVNKLGATNKSSLYCFGVKSVLMDGHISAMSTTAADSFIDDTVIDAGAVSFNAGARVLTSTLSFTNPDDSLGTLSVYWSKPDASNSTNYSTAYQVVLNIVEGTVDPSTVAITRRLVYKPIDALEGVERIGVSKGKSYSIQIQYVNTTASGATLSSKYGEYAGTGTFSTVYAGVVPGGSGGSPSEDTAPPTASDVEVTAAMGAAGAPPTLSAKIKSTATNVNAVAWLSVIYTNTSAEDLNDPVVANITGTMVNSGGYTSKIDLSSYSGTPTNWLGATIEYTIGGNKNVISNIIAIDANKVVTISPELPYTSGSLTFTLKTPWWKRTNSNGKSFRHLTVAIDAVNFKENAATIKNGFLPKNVSWTTPVHGDMINASGVTTTLYYRTTIANTYTYNVGTPTSVTISNTTRSLIDNAQSSANTAQSTANTAQTAANTAQGTANGALTAAGNAQTTANNAQETANNAQSLATSAYNGTVDYRADNAPTNAVTNLSIVTVDRYDGGFNIDMTFSYTQGAKKADSFLILYKSGDTPLYTDPAANRFLASINGNSTSGNYRITIPLNTSYGYYGITIYAGKTTTGGMTIGNGASWGPGMFWTSNTINYDPTRIHRSQAPSWNFLDNQTPIFSIQAGDSSNGIGDGNTYVSMSRYYIGSSGYTPALRIFAIGTAVTGMDYGVDVISARQFRLTSNYGVKIAASGPSTTGLQLILGSEGPGKFLECVDSAGTTAWSTINQVPSYGTTGQVLTKTAGGYEWQTPSSSTSGYSGTIRVVTNVSMDGSSVKTKTLTVSNGLITAVSSETSWTLTPLT